ncbi:class I SAM-dependent methyltransferase [Streptomyces sp. NPDC002746]
MTATPHEPAPGAASRCGEDLFATTAADYDRYRPGVPNPAVRLLAAPLLGTPDPVLLDLGTGTGQVPRALLPVVPHMAHLDLVDVNGAMLAQATAGLQPLLGSATLSSFTGEAHTFAPHKAGRVGRAADLVTCCRAFHWMNRPAVLNMADRVTAPHAVVAVMGDGSLWTYESDWTAALRSLIRSYLGERRRAGSRGTYAEPRRSYEDDLAASSFSDVTERRFPIVRAWTPDDVIGYLRSTSFARPALFGDRHQQFEAEALNLLSTHARDGVLEERAVFTVLLAQRPGVSR